MLVAKLPSARKNERVASASLRRALIGKMSFVGPRPDVPGYADKLAGNDREVLKLRPVQEIAVEEMKITQAILDDLTAQAKASPRLRMNTDLRNSPSDGSQRILNAIEPGRLLPIHRHRHTSETVVCLRGRLVEEFYDERGDLVDSVEVAPGGSTVAINVPIGQWHSVRALESGTVILECKDGKYEPTGPKDILGVGDGLA